MTLSVSEGCAFKVTYVQMIRLVQTKHLPAPHLQQWPQAHL